MAHKKASGHHVPRSKVVNSSQKAVVGEPKCCLLFRVAVFYGNSNCIFKILFTEIKYFSKLI